MGFNLAVFKQCKELTILRLYGNDTWRPNVEPTYFPDVPENLVKVNNNFNLFISCLPDDGYKWTYGSWLPEDNHEARFRKLLNEDTTPKRDPYGKMPFLEEVFFHAFYPYSELGKTFDWMDYRDWQRITRYIGTDAGLENSAFKVGMIRFLGNKFIMILIIFIVLFKAAKLHTESGGNAFYWSLDGPSGNYQKKFSTYGC